MKRIKIKWLKDFSDANIQEGFFNKDFILKILHKYAYKGNRLQKSKVQYQNRKLK